MNMEIIQLLDSYRNEADGEVTSRSRVIDRLLDLRLEAEEAALVALVDRALEDVPGRTTVPTNWWMDQIDVFSASLDVETS
jgi:hypothetical protein